MLQQHKNLLAFVHPCPRVSATLRTMERKSLCRQSPAQSLQAHLASSELHRQKCQPLRKMCSLSTASQIAESRGGLCLSTTYKNSQETLRWKCAHGHEWEAGLGNVVHHNTGCPTCARAARSKYSLHTAVEVAAEKGGHCLSTEYKTTLQKLLWRCAHGHEWQATLSSIVHHG
eukprot:1833900-Amphidinium_carterae.1